MGEVEEEKPYDERVQEWREFEKIPPTISRRYLDLYKELTLRRTFPYNYSRFFFQGKKF
jgi:hypothetical protein